MNTTGRDWLWYTLATIVLWAAWSLFSKAAADGIPPLPMFVVYIFGNLVVAFAVFAVTGFKVETNRRGWLFGLLSGAISGTGGIAFFAALRYGKSPAVVVTLTSLYPLGTVLVAPFILKEKLTRSQWIGVGFAIVAIVLLCTS
jgi:bacterial/archaeal transporter family protein